MKKSLTRKLTIAVIALVFAVVSLSTSTYAWFTMSNEAQINAFEAEVKAGEGIEIAVTATNDNTGAQWYTGNVPASVVETAFQENGFQQFDALTTVNNGAAFVGLDAASNDGKGYVSFYVHVKTAEAGTVNLTQIKLASNQSKTVDGIQAWKSDAAYKLPAGENGAIEGAAVAVGDDVTYKVEDAARIAIETKEGQSTSIKLYEKQEDAQNNNFAGVSSVYGSYSYYNSKNPDKPLSKNAGVNHAGYTTEQVENTTLSNTENNVELLLGTTTSQDNVITFQVKIWIEGWDTECLNAIFGQALTVQFKLALAE